MAGDRLNMKDIKEIKRLRQLGLGKRQIARALNIHRNTVSKYINELDAPSAPAVADEKSLQENTWSSDISEIPKVFCNIMCSEFSS